MRTTSFRLKNYKSYMDSGDVRLQNGFNIICGRNNAGKSALIEPFNISTWESRPHRESSIAKGFEPTQSTADFTIITTGSELKNCLLSAPVLLNCAVPRVITTGANPALEIDRFFHFERIELKIRRTGGGSWEVKECLLDSTQVDANVVSLTVNSDRSFAPNGYSPFPSGFNSLISQLIGESWFSFKAERLAIEDHVIEVGEVLLPNAQNLSSVLHNFSLTRRREFDNYVREISLIVPNIADVVLKTVQKSHIFSGTFQAQPHPFANISIRLKGSPEDRDDLVFSLAESGTGVGQVLAIVYAIMSNKNRKTIIIDEPNSFLNPGSVRSLIDLMERYNQHQYIITTHSPEVMSTDNAAISVTSWAGERSVVTTLEKANVRDIRHILEEVGARLSDVFGADEIVWVEGPTESACFPLLINEIGISVSKGTKFIPVSSATEIAKNTEKARLIVDIYERLSSANAIIPPAVAISLDQENFSPSQIEMLSRRLGAKVCFLKRRCLENYLIVPRAIDAVLAQIGFLSNAGSSTLSRVEEWLAKNAADPKFKVPKNWNGDLSDQQFLLKVDGARLLSDLFESITDQKYIFMKTEHSPLLLKWILQHDREAIDELLAYVRGIFNVLRN